MMIELKNTPFTEFLNLQGEQAQNYVFALQYGIFEGKDYFDFGEISEQSFGFVKDLQDLLFHGLTFKNCIEFISEKTEKDLDEIAKIPIFNLHQQRLYFRDSVEKINNIERIALVSSIKGIEDAAGIDVFNDYRSFLQYDALAGGDVTKFDEISKLPYNVCLTKLKLQKDRADYEKRLSEMMYRTK